MNTRRFDFFNGAAIAAQYALPNASPGLLNVDARHLASLSSTQMAKIATFKNDKTTVLALAWVDYRRGSPQDPLNPQTLIHSISQRQVHEPAFRVARIAAIENERLFTTRPVARLLHGAQSSLSILQPENTTELLVNDLHVIQRAIPQFSTYYLGSGVPRKLIPELVTHEYAFFRVTHPGSALQVLGGWFGSGPSQGLIDLTTIPSPADIWVDGKAMGQQSPAMLIASEGTRKVKAVRGALKAEESVNVAAAKKVAVNLKLV